MNENVLSENICVNCTYVVFVKRITNVHCFSFTDSRWYQTLDNANKVMMIYFASLHIMYANIRYMAMEDNIFFARSCFGFYLFDYYALQTSFYINHIILFTIIISSYMIFIVLFCIVLYRVFYMEYSIFKYLHNKYSVRLNVVLHIIPPIRYNNSFDLLPF